MGDKGQGDSGTFIMLERTELNVQATESETLKSWDPNL